MAEKIEVLGRRLHGGLGTFPIPFGYISYRIRILMYPACILKDTRILMYPDVSQMYLTCSVTFQENTCILIFYMYFTRIPKESNIHLRYTSDTSKYMYLMRFLDVTLDTYQDTSAHQDTCIFMDSSSRYIKIHRDTKSRYMYLGRVMVLAWAHSI